MSEHRSAISQHPIIAGVVATVAGGLILTVLLSLAPGKGSGPQEGTPTPPSGSTAPSAGEVLQGTASLFLADVPQEDFVQQTTQSRRGSASIGGKDFPSSYWYGFINCGGCTEVDELNIAPTYRRLVGTLGLTDESRHDDVIDGTLTFEIYTNDRLAFGPKRAEYPDQVSFDVSMTDVSRVRLVVRDGDNGEFPCWCGARFE